MATNNNGVSNTASNNNGGDSNNNADDGGSSGVDKNTSTDGLSPPLIGRERHVLQRREELRFEVTFGTSSTSTLSNASGTTSFILQKGSCELYGCELAIGKTYTIAHGGIKAALFTWHGCVIDLGAVDDNNNESNSGTGGVEFFAYTSDETDANVAFVNTHAQLEALRDEAATVIAAGNGGCGGATGDGPRVMIVGPPECGKTTLAKILVAYACKVGRTPLMVDLDPMDNSLSVPGSLTVAPMASCAVSVESYATTGLPINGMPSSSSTSTTSTSTATPSTSNNNNGGNSVHPLVLYHGSTSKLHPDLFKGQIDSMAESINKRLDRDELARSSGIIVNTNGWIRDDGYECLLYAAKSLKISVLLILGHDRLYSMLTSHYKKQEQQQQEESSAADAGAGEQQQQQQTNIPALVIPKILKLPRSGGVVSRPSRFVTSCRSRAVKRYFYGDLIPDPNVSTSEDGGGGGGGSNDDGAGGGTSSEKNNKPYRLVNQLTPFAIQLPFAEIKVYKLSSMALSGSVLPVGQQQSTDAIQLVEIDIQNDTEEAKSLQHSLIAICHPTAVDAYNKSGRGRDLVTAGVAGFCVVDKVVTETDRLHLLSPCAGCLPSKTMIIGDITWME
jgi:polyribonucleotide 5'-hydroxyl-kinase